MEHYESNIISFAVSRSIVCHTKLYFNKVEPVDPKFYIYGAIMPNNVHIGKLK